MIIGKGASGAGAFNEKNELVAIVEGENTLLKTVYLIPARPWFEDFLARKGLKNLRQYLQLLMSEQEKAIARHTPIFYAQKKL